MKSYCAGVVICGETIHQPLGLRFIKMGGTLSHLTMGFREKTRSMSGFLHSFIR